MSRAAWIALGVGVAAFAALVLLGVGGLAAVMPSYLGAWLVLLALPLGSLPVVMSLELLGRPEGPVTAVLRRLVAVMPLAAVLAAPVLVRAHRLFPPLAGGGDGFPGVWMSAPFFLGRAIVFLLAWTALAWVFARRPRALTARRSTLAGAGLALHVVMATLAAVDWVGAVEPGFISSALGVLVISAQCGLAVPLAVAMAAVRGGRTASRGLAPDRRDLVATQRLGTALAVLLAGWGFIAFTQYLVVWSANLPAEVLWYQHRSAGIGQAAEYSAGVLCALALVGLLPQGLARRADVLASVAAALAVMHALEMLWLVTPAFRAQFTVGAADVLALAGAGALGIGSALALGDRLLDERSAHGAA